LPNGECRQVKHGLDVRSLQFTSFCGVPPVMQPLLVLEDHS